MLLLSKLGYIYAANKDAGCAKKERYKTKMLVLNIKKNNIMSENTHTHTHTQKKTKKKKNKKKQQQKNMNIIDMRWNHVRGTYY